MSSTISDKVIEVNNLKNEFLSLGNKYRAKVKEVIRQYLVEHTAPIKETMPVNIKAEVSFCVQFDDEGYRVFYSQLLLEENTQDEMGSAEIYKSLTPHNLNYPLNPEKDGYTDNASSELMEVYKKYVDVLNKFNQFLGELDVVGEDSLLEPETYIVVK